MSTVERALEKIRKARGAEAAARPQVARVTEGAPPGGDPGQAASQKPHRSIEFDLDMLKNAGLVSTANSKLFEQYRVIKQPLLKKAAELQGDASQRGNLVMVGSALAGEGKTFTCVNLSLSLATERDWEVLLIDVDCKNPQLSHLLGVENEPGFLDLLKNKDLDLESLVLETNIPGLSVLPLGGRDAHAAEFLASLQMKRLCERLAVATPNRLVLFDSSPLLLTTEPLILATHVGQVVVVVQADRTPQQAVRGAIEKLDDTKAIGVVLNRAEEAVDEGTRYGGYEYRYAKA